jgi:hypothetical protein
MLNYLSTRIGRYWSTLRSMPVLNPTAMLELAQEREGHPALREHGPHLRSALEWLAAAQDATPDDGISRGFSFAYSTYFRGRGWQPSYPETTGYIIPTLFEAAARTGRQDLAARAVRAAIWECEIQLPSGAVQGGVIGQGNSPAVFNTGQVMLGWLSAFEQTKDDRFADAARRAGEYLVTVQEPNGHWRKGNSAFARGDTTLYNARVAWALAEAGVRLGIEDFKVSALRNLKAVAGLQTGNGWFPYCCLTDSRRPLLHTIAYTIRGLLEGGRVLQDDQLLQAAVRASASLLNRVREDGWMSGRFHPDWTPAAEWSCLTGEAQMANNWMRLHAITGERRWLEPVPRVLRFLKRTQNRTSDEVGLRGGIKGSFPMSGEYGRFEILNWATKYFADALMRHDDVLQGRSAELMSAFILA